MCNVSTAKELLRNVHATFFQVTFNFDLTILYDVRFTIFKRVSLLFFNLSQNNSVGFCHSKLTVRDNLFATISFDTNTCDL